MSSPDCHLWLQLARGGYVGDLPPQKEMSVAKAMAIFDQESVCTPKAVSDVPTSSQSATAPSTSTIKSSPACDGFPEPVVESAIWLTLQPVKVGGRWPAPFQVRIEDWDLSADPIRLEKSRILPEARCRNTKCDGQGGKDGLFKTRWTPTQGFDFVEIACGKCHDHWAKYGLAWPDLPEQKTISSLNE